MVKVKKILFAYMVYIMGGHLWLYYSKYDENVGLMLHAQVLASSSYMVVKNGHYDRLLTKNNFRLEFNSNKYLII